MKSTRGFTLIELVITITLTGIIFLAVSVFLNRPIKAYTDLYRRGDLTTIADLAAIRMERDIRRAVPNSLRVKQSGNLIGVEFVNAVEGMRYRQGNPGGNNAILKFTSTDTDFNVLNNFQFASLGNQNYRVVIYNTGNYSLNSDNPTPGQNLYSPSASPGPLPPASTHVITTPSTSVVLSNGSTEAHVNLSPGFQFAFESPRQRVFFVDTPISYVCNLNNGTLTRYWGYSITQVQPIDGSVSPLSGAQSALLANDVSACSFSYSAGSATRNGLLSVNLKITRSGESANLFYQINVSNAP